MISRNLRTPLVAASLALVLCLGAVVATASSNRAQGTVARGKARNRARAQRAAERRVMTVNLPPGTTLSRSRPTGLGGLLEEPIAIPGGHRHATAHRFWTVPRPPKDVLAWLRKHPPRRTRSVGEIGGTGGNAIEFELLPGAPRSGDLGGLLFVNVVKRSSGGSAVRADAFEDWNVPRSPRARIPASARFLGLTVSPGSGGIHTEGEVPRPTRYASTADQALITKLVRVVDRQPAYQEVDVPSCGPPGEASEHHLFTLDFRTARHGRLLASVSQEIPFGICSALILKLGPHRTFALEGGENVLRAAHGLIQRATPKP
jgi:hypothetical protein